MKLAGLHNAAADCGRNACTHYLEMMSARSNCVCVLFVCCVPDVYIHFQCGSLSKNKAHQTCGKINHLKQFSASSELNANGLFG